MKASACQALTDEDYGFGCRPSDGSEALAGLVHRKQGGRQTWRVARKGCAALNTGCKACQQEDLVRNQGKTESSH